MESTLQEKFVALEQAKTALLTTIAQSTELQQRFQPASDKWCMLQIAQHLILAEKGIYSFLTKYPPRAASFADRLRTALALIPFYFFMRFAIVQVKAPKATVPIKILPLAHIEENWAKNRLDLKSYLDNFSAKQMNYQVFKHPFAGKMTISQTLDFMRIHIQHHLKQAQIIKKQNTKKQPKWHFN